MEPCRPRGFSLIELLVALAAAAILLGVGAPTLGDVVRDGRISSQANALARALYLARAEAVKRGVPVTVCPRAGDSLCGGAADWDHGWLVFADPSASAALAETVATVDAGDEMLVRHSPFERHNGLDVYGVAPSASEPRQSTAWVRYTPEGSTRWSGGASFGSFVICDAARGASHSRALNVTVTGSIRSARPAPGGSVPLDARGLALPCPGGAA